MNLLFGIIAVPSLMGIGTEGIEIKIFDNGEVYGHTYNRDNLVGDYALEKTYVAVISQDEVHIIKDLIVWLNIGDYTVDDVPLETITDDIITFLLPNGQTITYKHSDYASISPQFRQLIKKLDEIINFKQLFRAEDEEQEQTETEEVEKEPEQVDFSNIQFSTSA